MLLQIKPMTPDITPRNAQSLWVGLIPKKRYSGKAAFVQQASIWGSVRFRTICPGPHIFIASTPYPHTHVQFL